MRRVYLTSKYLMNLSRYVKIIDSSRIWKVTDLSECYDVWNHTLILETPEIGTCAAKPSLNLICNAQASSLPNNIICCWEVARCKFNSSSHTLSVSFTEVPTLLIKNDALVIRN